MDANQVENFKNLTYLGLRMAFGGKRSDSSLKALANAAVARELRRHELTENPAGHDLAIESKEFLDEALRFGRGAILCLPHMGLFNFIPAHLAMSGIPTTMVVDSKNYEQEVANYEEWARLYEGSHPDPMRYVNAESPQSAWLMLRDLKAGRVVFFGFDANGGLQDQDVERTSVDVEFVGLRIYVRKGAAFMSAKANAPILPGILTSCDEGKSTLKIFRPIQKTEDDTLEDYCRRGMQFLYRMIETEVTRDPACWEQWRHLPTWVARDSDLPDFSNITPELLLNSRLKTRRACIVPIKIDGVGTLANQGNGLAYAETALVSSVLNFFDEARTVEELLAASITEDSESDTLAALVTLIGSGFVGIVETGEM